MAINQAPVTTINSGPVKRGYELRVNTAVAGAQLDPRIAVLAKGGFVVSWVDGSLGVGGATGDASGTAIRWREGRHH